MIHDFLPVCRADMEKRGWDQCDFVYVCGDAYVDHPSFGAAIITRLLESLGYRVAVLAQPRFDTPEEMKRFGRPRLGFLVSGGNIDSMVAHYTAARRLRSEDFYSPGCRAGLRPDRATIVYCRLIREAYGDVPIVIGGLEASLRRFAHYDYWDDAVRPSILAESGADLLIYGMGEHPIAEIADRMARGEHPAGMRDIRGTCYLCPLTAPLPENAVSCASFDKVSQDKKTYARACRLQLEEQDHVTGRPIVQKHGEQYLVQNPPALPLETAELDAVAELPYERWYHPCYEKEGGVPAIKEVEFSLTHNRGCFGACNFCSIAFHQGRYITTRSHASLIREAEGFTKNPHFKGYIHDVGGPTADFRAPACKKQKTQGLCRDKKCLAPTRCPAVRVDHTDYVQLLRELRAIPGVKKVFVRSGLRYDYMMGEEDDTFLTELVRYHISGQLKVAPEHISDKVLMKLGKPENAVFQAFCKKYKRINEELGLKQYMVPYLMSSHPGSTLKEAVELAEYLRDLGYMPEQVQDFYPTPSTISTCMYYTGVDPRTMEKVYVPNSPHEKAMQRALIQYRNPDNYDLVHEALVKAGRTDLIGFDKNCLIKPRKMKNAANEKKSQYGASNKQSGNRSNVQHKNSAQKQGQNQKQQMNTKNKKSIRNVHKKKQK